MVEPVNLHAVIDPIWLKNRKSAAAECVIRLQKQWISA